MSVESAMQRLPDDNLQPTRGGQGSTVGRLASWRVAVPSLPAPARAWPPAVVFVYGFTVLILAGAVLLTLPIASASGRWTPFLDALFTATSAVCVTGLVVYDTGVYWSGFGQVVILTLFQVGGVGFMTSTTALLLLSGRRATLRQRVLLRESLGGGEIGSVPSLARRIIIFTLIAEAIGAAILTLRFSLEMEAPKAIWWGIFHAISGFNNAGFDLLGGYRSLIPYSHDAVVLLTITTLFVLGGISYTAVEDLVRQRRFARLTLDTKLVLVTTGCLVAVGTVGLLFLERGSPSTLGGMDWGPRILNAFFLTASRTAGFSSVDIGQMTEESLFLLMGLMFIGGASGSTAGGIKVQTFSLLLCAIIATVRGLDEVEAFRRQVPIPQVLRALTVALLFVALLFAIALLLNVTERFIFHAILFEAVSALATVGYSTGITPETTPAGRAILIVTMFVGRLGPLTLVLALAARERRTRYHWLEEPVKIG